jgi:hypothetical protein
MAGTVTLEHVEELAAQLQPTERLKLAAHICERLSVIPYAVSPERSTEEQAQQERLANLDAWLAECDQVAELWEGEFDSAADLRRIRNEEA